LRRAVVGGLLIALVAGMLLPVYTDEIGWRLRNGRGSTGWTSFIRTIADRTRWPCRHVAGGGTGFFTRFPDPMFVRVSGVAYAIVFIVMVLRLVKQIGRSYDERHTLAIIASALMGWASCRCCWCGAGRNSRSFWPPPPRS
jgi:hypothetical protein